MVLGPLPAHASFCKKYFVKTLYYPEMKFINNTPSYAILKINIILQQPDVEVACQGHGSGEDKKEATHANGTGEKETGDQCGIGVKGGGRIEGGFEVAGDWDISDQRMRWESPRRYWFVGNAVKLGMRYLFIQVHAVFGHWARPCWGAERGLTGAPDL